MCVLYTQGNIFYFPNFKKAVWIEKQGSLSQANNNFLKLKQKQQQQQQQGERGLEHFPRLPVDVLVPHDYLGTAEDAHTIFFHISSWFPMTHINEECMQPAMCSSIDVFSVNWKVSCSLRAATLSRAIKWFSYDLHLHYQCWPCRDSTNSCSSSPEKSHQGFLTLPFISRKPIPEDGEKGLQALSFFLGFLHVERPHPPISTSRSISLDFPDRVGWEMLLMARCPFPAPLFCHLSLEDERCVLTCVKVRRWGSFIWASFILATVSCQSLYLTSKAWSLPFLVRFLPHLEWTLKNKEQLTFHMSLWALLPACCLHTEA